MSRSRRLADRARRQADEAYHEFWATLVESSEILNRLAPNRRRAWLADVIRDLHDEQKGLCALCGNQITLGNHHVDHIIPFCYGGGNEQGNIQLAHPECNNRKRTQVDPQKLLRYLEDRSMNLPAS